MPNGTPGDHPLSDMLIHGLHPFPPQIESLLRQIVELQPDFPDGKRPYREQVRIMEAIENCAYDRDAGEVEKLLRDCLVELEHRPPSMESTS
jgi:hypothetical protein